VLSHSHGGEKWGPFHLHGYQKQVPNVLHSLHYTQCASLVAQAPTDYSMKAPLVLHSANMNSHVWMQRIASHGGCWAPSYLQTCTNDERKAF
jgi:hypothetical protein